MEVRVTKHPGFEFVEMRCLDQSTLAPKLPVSDIVEDDYDDIGSAGQSL